MGNLYVVATPIGNLQDITIRAARTLLEVPFVLAESTSKAGILLEFVHKTFPKPPTPGQSPSGAAPKIISFTEDQEEQKIPEIIRLLEENNAALISEAGTPLISDPGFKLVREAIKRGINIITIPGPSAVIAALTVSGLPCDRFTFLGFLPKSMEKKRKELEKVKESHATVIIFESPHRLLDTLKAIQTVFGDIDVVIARELTKIHEEIIRGKVSDALSRFEQKHAKGELVILFSIIS